MASTFYYALSRVSTAEGISRLQRTTCGTIKALPIFDISFNSTKRSHMAMAIKKRGHLGKVSAYCTAYPENFARNVDKAEIQT
jgi:hypothetical protein